MGGDSSGDAVGGTGKEELPWVQSGGFCLCERVPEPRWAGVLGGENGSQAGFGW